MILNSNYQSDLNISSISIESTFGYDTNNGFLLKKGTSKNKTLSPSLNFSHSSLTNDVVLDKIEGSKVGDDNFLLNAIGNEWLTINQDTGVYDMGDKQIQQQILDTIKDTNEKISRIEIRVDSLFNNMVSKDDLKREIEINEKFIIEKISNTEKSIKNWIMGATITVLLSILQLFFSK